MNIVDKALQIAAKAHEGQKDLDGEAYILHPIRVGLMGKTDEERAAGFLHDVMEDCGYTPEDLLQEGIPESLVNALMLLTHEEGVSYEDYVQKIIDSNNPIALHVKYHDLQHNYERGKRFPRLQEKHGKALAKVEAAVKDMDTVYPYDFEEAKQSGYDVAIFAAGCFWGVQHYFQKHQGVVRSLVGYTGGTEEYPTYDEVRQHKTGHLEAVLVEYDSQEVDFEELCKLFFEIHDPSQTDGQGPDIGEQYRSGVFYTTEEQRQTTEKLASILRKKGFVVETEILPAGDFWVAEEYHQNYYENTGGSPYCHIRERKF